MAREGAGDQRSTVLHIQSATHTCTYTPRGMQCTSMWGYVRVQLNNMRACFIIFIWPETKHLSLDRVSNTERKQVRVRVWEQEREWENENASLSLLCVVHLTPANGVTTQNHRMTVSKSKIKIIFYRVFVFLRFFCILCVLAAGWERMRKILKHNNNLAAICTNRWMRISKRKGERE